MKLQEMENADVNRKFIWRLFEYT